MYLCKQYLSSLRLVSSTSTSDFMFFTRHGGWFSTGTLPFFTNKKCHDVISIVETYVKHQQSRSNRIVIQSNLSIKGTQGNIKMCPL